MSKTFVRIGDLPNLGIPFSRASIYRFIKAGTFPAPIKLGANTSAWLLSEVEAWKQARIAARDAA